ncbi:MAG: hypothetical protein ABFQ64_07765 [Campylobacterota bacterium]
MKTFTIILTFLVLISGCASKNAFEQFDMSEKQELSANALQRSKVKHEEKVNGIVSTVYLNFVSPKEYSDGEYFYVYTYLKNKNYEFRFLLNGKEPISVKELPPTNEFTELTSINNEWSKYYLVKFPKQGDKLSFVFENGPYSSDILKFEKDE